MKNKKDKASRKKMTKVNNLAVALENIGSIGTKFGDVWCQNVDGKVQITESNLSTVKIWGRKIMSQKQGWK